jgi:hypothetical protein
VTPAAAGIDLAKRARKLAEMKVFPPLDEKSLIARPAALPHACSGSTLDRHKKGTPRAVHSRGLQLALLGALLSRRLRGCRGTGVSRRKAALPNLPDPARAIRDSHHILEHFEQSRRIGPRRSISPAEPLWCLIGGRTIRTGKGKT